MSNLRWLHLSDLHTGLDAFGVQYLMGKMVAHLREKRDSSGFVPDLVFFTGDISNKGQPTEYGFFTDNVLLPLLELYNGFDLQNIIIVPGNHDVDRSRSPLIDTYAIFPKQPQLFDCSSQGAVLREGLSDRFSAFRQALPTPKDGDDLFGEQACFLRALNTNGLQIGILGVNTAWLSQSDRDKNQLTPGKFGIAKALDSLGACDLRFVVGHHPVSWFNDEDREAIEAIFAQYNVIYLHGHLHETASEYTERNRSRFLSIQAGAIFESRESKQRPHTIVFGEYSKEETEIVLEPFRWNAINNEWALYPNGLSDKFRPDGESRWHYPLPVPVISRKPLPKGRRALELPAGWLEISRATLARWTEVSLTTEQVLSYFDGRPPAWADAASIFIPHREVVSSVVSGILGSFEQKRLGILLLTGPGGEGKSTVLKQSCCAVLRRDPQIRILYRNDDDQSLSSQFVLNELSPADKYLIVADEAGNLVQDLYFQAKILGSRPELNIVYLLAARDTDWFAASGRLQDWTTVSSYSVFTLRGVSNPDAHAIVTAWSQYGTPGMQALSGYPIDQAATMLVSASKLEEANDDGAFLGAMLMVRFGASLKHHIDAVLQRLAQRTSVPGVTLLEALAPIVALHRLDLRILSKDVLAGYLSCKVVDIRRSVLNPLGDEAVVSSAGGYILVRHKAIAQAAYELMEENFNIDFDQVYLDLVACALTMVQEGRFVAHTGKWRFLSRNLFEAGERNLALRIAEFVVNLEPGNTFFLVHLAALRRESGRSDLALATFRTSKIGVTPNRAFYTEWGAAERVAGNYFAATWLAGLAISDQQSHRYVDNDDAKMALAELCKCARLIYETLNLGEFLLMGLCAQAVALRLPLSENERVEFNSFIEGHDSSAALPRTVVDSIRKIEEGVIAARSLCGPGFDFLPLSVDKLTFTSLVGLVTARTR